MNYSLNSKTTLGFKWSEKENDWMIYFPRSGSGSYLHSQLLERRFFLSLLQELLNRDYDLSTFCSEFIQTNFLNHIRENEQAILERKMFWPFTGTTRQTIG